MKIRNVILYTLMCFSLCGFQVLHLEPNSRTLTRALKQDVVLKKISFLEDSKYYKDQIESGYFNYVKTVGLSPEAPALTFYAIDGGVHLGCLYAVAHDMSFFKKFSTGKIIDVLDNTSLPHIQPNQVGVVTASGGTGVHAVFIEIMTWDSGDLLSVASYPISGYISIFEEQILNYNAYITGYNQKNQLVLDVYYYFDDATNRKKKLQIALNANEYKLLSGSKEIFEQIKWVFDAYKNHS